MFLIDCGLDSTLASDPALLRAPALTHHNITVVRFGPCTSASSSSDSPSHNRLSQRSSVPTSSLAKLQRAFMKTLVFKTFLFVGLPEWNVWFRQWIEFLRKVSGVNTIIHIILLFAHLYLAIYFLITCIDNDRQYNLWTSLNIYFLQCLAVMIFFLTNENPILPFPFWSEQKQLLGSIRQFYYL